MLNLKRSFSEALSDLEREQGRKVPRIVVDENYENKQSPKSSHNHKRMIFDLSSSSSSPSDDDSSIPMPKRKCLGLETKFKGLSLAIPPASSKALVPLRPRNASVSFLPDILTVEDVTYQSYQPSLPYINPEKGQLVLWSSRKRSPGYEVVEDDGYASDLEIGSKQESGLASSLDVEMISE